MGYDLSIHTTDLPHNLVTRWMRRLNACNRMAYESHPDVGFDVGRYGFWPIKVSAPRRWPRATRQEYMSGFEMSVSNFDATSYFNLHGVNGEAIRRDLLREGLDLDLWDSFRFLLGISFNPLNKFEPDLSFLSAAILTQEMEGLCYDPQTGTYLEKDKVFSWAEAQVKRFDENAKNKELVAHPFECWR